MKSLLLITLFLVSCVAYAQNWCPPGAVWTYNYYAMSANGYSTLTYEKDTVIGSQACQKLVRVTRQNPGNLTLVGLPEYTFERNDTVFFYYTDAFRPVYFFTAQLGDTIPFYNNQSFAPCDTITRLVVDSVGTTVINGETLRFYRTYNIVEDSSGLQYSQQVTVIEKLGAIQNYIIPYYTCYTDGDAYDLRCYKDSNFAVYQTNLTVACDYLYIGIDDVDNQVSLTLHPNPAHSQIEVNADGINISQYTVLDYSGKEVLASTASSGNVLSVDISHLSQGVYLVKLELANGQYAVRRFVKD